MKRERGIGVLAWAMVLALIGSFLGPVWRDYSGSVVGPFGGIDALLQLGLLEWSARHWWDVGHWVDLPIFFPVSGAIGFMDSLLGQAWMVWPLRALFQPTMAALYNTAFLGSLLLAALGMATLWRASGGTRWASGVAALALLGAPYTHAQIGHLNQLPPPFVLFALAALVAALRRQRAGLSTGQFWWLLAVSFILQAAWGWYGFAYAVIGVVVLKTAWFVHRISRRRDGWAMASSVTRAAILPFLATILAVGFLAQPQMELGRRYDDFRRTDLEVRQGSADIQHFLNRGVYRSGPADWIGRGSEGEDRYLGRDRQVLHPGWMALVLFAIGWWRRGYLPFQRRRFGRSFLVMGVLGLVLAFGDSVGVPGTGWRLPLPLDALREIVPPFKAFRGAWRFSWLMVIALAWWSAVGMEQLVTKYRRGRAAWLAPLVPLVLLFCLSLPVAVPALKVPLDGGGASLEDAAPVLTLPAPATEYDEDRTEALWLARSLTTGCPVTGGATGWVPPEVRQLRQRMLACEQGEAQAGDLIHEMRHLGVAWAELALRSGDDERIDFWRRALLSAGAERQEPWPQAGYEMYRLTD